MAEQDRTLILEDTVIKSKINRMAFEIYENNLEEKILFLAGIDGQGYALAKLLAAQLRKISPMEIVLLKVFIDKRTPEKSEVKVDASLDELNKKVIVLVDDVLNTGKVMTYSMKPFLSVAVKKLELAVLVNRSHLQFPVHPRYTGYALSTTLSEHIEVILDKSSAVYLH
ncbi:MAG: phosphoribosyltransferase [Bacteroidetes bacterium]|nr:phosphoribosyltransferase [Bacteroidota bacterium]